MQERHNDRELYFREQYHVTEKHVLPYLRKVMTLDQSLIIAEIGCGEAGNLKPFLDMGCRAYGIDIAAHKIENAKRFYANHPQKQNLTLIAADIYDVDPISMEKFDLIIMRDTIEHIPNQSLFLGNLKKFMAPGGKILIAFPPWRMPFGGHQQICKSKVLSQCPYLHLLPEMGYRWILKRFGETAPTINALMEIRDTRLSIQRFHQLVAKNKYKFSCKEYYLINPNYEIKFKLKSRKLPFILTIPYIRDFFTTAFYCVLEPEEG